MKKVLIVGSGGREHALAWKMAQSPEVEKIFVAPGNGGTADELKIENVNIKATDIQALADFAETNTIDLTLIGPEAPLAAGIVDLFQEKQLRCLGPSQAAAMLETSKTFAKEFMQRHNIPTAAYATFTDAQQAKEYVFEQPKPLVIKADGLAAGKGVVIAHTDQEAYTIIDDMLCHRKFGQASCSIIIEEFLTGEEVSFIVMSDGKNNIPLATSQDYKRLLDDNEGPNTGGMGAYSPAPFVTPELHNQIMNRIIEPTIEGMLKEGRPYIGFLYAGLMITPDGVPKVLEFNCRLGDPETQPILMRLESDLFTLCNATLNKELDGMKLQWSKYYALGLVLVAGGYPGTYDKGDVIEGIETIEPEYRKIFHAGTNKNKDNKYLTNGGRVLCITSKAPSLPSANQLAYQCATTIHFKNMFYRTDIGNFEKNELASLNKKNNRHEQNASLPVE